VLLFDIDGTLAPCRRRRAARHRRRVPRALRHGETFDGVALPRHDRPRHRPGRSRASRRSVDDATIDAICETYLVALAEEVHRAEDLSGVRRRRDAARRAGRRDALAIGLGTGNLREGARVKLERAPASPITSVRRLRLRSRAPPHHRPDRGRAGRGAAGRAARRVSRRRHRRHAATMSMRRGRSARTASRSRRAGIDAATLAGAGATRVSTTSRATVC